MANIEFNELKKVFADGTVAVEDFNLEIGDGEFVVLVGPSGSGKTTVLRMTAGLEAPTEGEVRIGGEPVNDVDPQDRNIAMVFQNYALYPHMSVYDNMAFGLKLRKTPKTEIDKRVKEAADMHRMVKDATNPSDSGGSASYTAFVRSEEGTWKRRRAGRSC